MGMRIWPISIISIAHVTEIQLHDFSDFLQQIDGLVDGRQAGRWKVGSYLPEDVLNAWVPVTFCEDLQYGKSLGGDAEITVP